MAFFKFRKGGGDDHPAPAPAAESVEVMRKRARHRLIGAAVLVLLGVIGFPLLFDSQPRPISVDIPIEIPDKNTVKPLATTTTPPPKPATAMLDESDAGKEHVSPKPTPATPAVTPPAARPAPVQPVTQPPAAVPSRASTGVVSGAGSTTPASAKPVSRPATKPETKPADKPVEKPVAKPVDKPAAHADDGAKAQALLEGRDSSKPAAAPASAGGAGRFIVQIGAYSDGVKAHEARVKLEKAGMKTYTQVAETKDGKRIRVRLGPFNGKAEADKAAEKVRKLDLPAAILEL